MLKELDNIVLTRNLPDYSLEKGDIGVIVHKYNSTGYEVEFLLANGKTVCVVTLTNEEIRPVHSEEILHVRALHSA
ncbi:MAG: DUF4926 domain-containing protein [Spirochaetia bacterium]